MKKKLKITFIVLFIILIITIIFINLLYILNIKTYRASLDVTIKNNRNENFYKLKQEVTAEYEKQIVQEPEEVNGLQIIFMNGTVEIKNTKLNLSKIYENYPNLSENYLFITDFLKSYKTLEQKSIKKDNGKILMEIKTNKNKYNVIQRLYVNEKNLIPEKLEIFDNNNNTKVYILYSEIEINI